MNIKIVITVFASMIAMVIPLFAGLEKQKKKLKPPRLKEPKTVLYDRAYYNTLVDRAATRRWAITLSGQYATQDRAIDCAGCSQDLSQAIFGTCPITIKDIYLFSKLSDDNKVRINNCDARAPERGGVPIGGTGIVFGGFRDDLYTTLLAPISLVFDAECKVFSSMISGVFRHNCERWESFSIACGVTIPFMSVYHSLDYTYCGGELFRRGFVPDTTQRETSVKQFFRDYSDVDDFITQAVFGSKCIAFENQQRKSGLGDISIFGSIEYHDQNSIECGLNIVLPTGGKADANILWSPVLGSGGSFLFNPFFQILCSTAMPYFNPFARVAVEIGNSFRTNNERAPTRLVNDERQQAQNIPGLSYPPTFEAFYVDPFSAFDTTIPLFGDKAPCLKKKLGTKAMIGLGSYAYEIFHSNFRWGIFYDYYWKGKDSYALDCSAHCCDRTEIDSDTMEKNTDQREHILSSNLTYKWEHLFEVGVGGQFTLWGRNIAKTRTLYLSFVAVF